MSEQIVLPNWPCAWGGPEGSGKIRDQEADFEVNEVLGFELFGSGEHAFLWVEKCGENTDYAARQLAQYAGVNSRDVGYAGLKDRHALTRQWFSVWLPGKDGPDWQAFEQPNITILQATRHNKKLKRGSLQGNRFVLCVRDWQGQKEDTINTLQTIKMQGLPNYFGAQRFGRNGQNINKALEMFLGKRVKRQQRSLYLSAVRSFLFNEILARRIVEKNWNLGLIGDTYLFDCSQQYFKTDHTLDETVPLRLSDLSIHPSGCLYGIGDDDNSADALALEEQVLDGFPELKNGLESSAVVRSRRPLRINVEQLEWRFSDDNLELTFFLPSGSYATSLLREVIQLL